MADRVRWIRSYVVKEPDGRLGSVCIYQANDPQSIRDHARCVGMPADQIRLRPHESDELSHYSSGTSDVEFLFPWGWDELEGIANRGNFDLTQHANHSGEKLDYFDQATNERYVPHVIEPAAGATRTAMAFLMARSPVITR